MATTTARTNRYASTCTDCHQHIPAGDGHLIKAADGWIVRCTDTAACATHTSASQAQASSREAQLAADPGVSGRWTATEEAALAAAGIDSPWDIRIAEALEAAGFHEAAAIERAADGATQATTSSSRRRSSTSRRRRACVTGGNCSSTTGQDCGGHNCDAN